MREDSHGIQEAVNGAAKLYYDAAVAMGAAARAADEIGETLLRDDLLKAAGKFSRIWADLRKTAVEIEKTS